LLAVVIALAKRALTWRIFLRSVVETINGTASIFFIAVGAALLTRFLAFTGVPAFLSEQISAMQLGPLQLMLMICVLYIFLGMFLDPLGCMLLTLPILLPILEAQQVDLIWFGIILVKLLEIGLITPPVGLNVFVIKSFMGDRVALTSIFRGVTWFIVSDLVVLSLLIMCHAIVHYLRQYDR